MMSTQVVGVQSCPSGYRRRASLAQHLGLGEHLGASELRWGLTSG